MEKASGSDVAEGLQGTTPNHDSRCRCGCVPNILSLFEMAKLREERKKSLKSSAVAGTLSEKGKTSPNAAVVLFSTDNSP
jgi:hypothetical protein